MTDRQSESVTAPPKCGISGCYARAGTSGFCSLDHELRSQAPAPAPEAPPEWTMEAARKAEPGWDEDDVSEVARLIHAAWLASEEARKVERLEKALRSAGEWIAAVESKLPMPGVGDTQMDVLHIIEAALAFPLVEETR